MSTPIPPADPPPTEASRLGAREGMERRWTSDPEVSPLRPTLVADHRRPGWSNPTLPAAGEPERPTQTPGDLASTTLYAATVECDGALCIVARGELDLASAPILTEALLAAEASDAPEIVLDIEAISFIDSTGLRALLEAHARSRRSGNRLRLTRGTPQAQRLFALVAADRHLPFID